MDISLPLLIALCLFFAAMVISLVAFCILELSIFFKYMRFNRVQVKDKTAKQVAEEMLAKLGYTDITVRRASYFWLIFFRNWGNRYSPRRKAIFLYNNILNKNTVTAIAIATQKVGLVIQHKNGEKKMAFRAKWETWTRLAPNLFLFWVTLGAVIDLAVNWNALTNFGIITMVFVAIAVIYTIIAFACLYLIIPTERRAGQLALETIKQHELLPAEYLKDVEGLYKTYVRKYIAEFIMAVLQLIYDIIYLVVRILPLSR